MIPCSLLSRSLIPVASDTQSNRTFGARWGRSLTISCLLLASFAATCLPGQAQKLAQAQSNAASSFVTIDAPGAALNSMRGTAILAIDSTGDVAGVYADTNNLIHTFIRSANGTITPFDISSAGSTIGAVPLAFDAAGDLVGVYADSKEVFHGFIRSASGTVTSFDAPSAGTASMQGTFPGSIDSAGDVAGGYVDTNNVVHGFVRLANGTTKSFDAPSGSLVGTAAVSINASGVIVGTYVDSSNVGHGFVRTTDGTVTPIDVPATATVPGAGSSSGQGTAAYAIDAAGDIAGTYVDSNNALHGYVRSASGTITAFSAPGAGTSTYQGTVPVGFDAAGDVAGLFIDANNMGYGFVRSASGTITTYNAPGAATVSPAIANAIRASLKPGRSAARNSKANGGVGGLTTLVDRSKNLLARVGAPISQLSSPLRAKAQDISQPTGGVFDEDGSVINGTIGLAIDAAGDIAGPFVDGEAVIHSFFRAANGSITVFDAPNAGSAVFQGTATYLINASGAIAGSYVDEYSVVHGFVLSNPSQNASTTTLTADRTSITYGQSVTLTATVASNAGTPQDGETVFFMNGSTTVGTATLKSGTATLSTTALSGSVDPATGLPGKTDSITAVYGGDLTMAGSTSTALAVAVAQATSTTTLAAPVISTTGQPLTTLTATVTGQYGGTPTGTVTFYYAGADGVAQLCSTTNTNSAPACPVTLAGGSASLSTSVLPPGSDTVTAVYSGDTNFSGSTSAAVDPSVPASTHGTGQVFATIGQTLDASGYPTGLIATVGTRNPTMPTGAVEFLDSSYGYKLLGTATLSAGQTQLTWSPAPTQLPSTLAPYCAVADNFDGDSFPDVAMLSEVWGRNTETYILNIMKGLGNGTFQLLSSTTLFTANYQSGFMDPLLAVGDFDGDGKKDLAVIERSDSDAGANTASVVIYHGNGDGTFTALPAATTAQVTGSRSFTAGDFNGDGKADLVLADTTGGLTLFLGNGDGTFAVKPRYAIPNSLGATALSALKMRSTDATDLLAVADTTGLLVLSANADGTFSPAMSPLSTNPTASLIVGDFNGDRSQDIIASGPAQTLFLNNKNNGFTSSLLPSSQLPLYNGSTQAVADFNQDGLSDLFVPFGEYSYENQYNSSTVLLTANTTATATITGVTVSGPGPHMVIARYTGDSNYGAMRSGAIPLGSLAAPTATPVIAVQSGTYSTIQTVAITDSTPGAEIYYTTDGSTPASYSPVYMGPVIVATSQKLQAIAIAANYAPSAVVSATYTINSSVTATPAISLPAGAYPFGQAITISDATPDAMVYYTTDGSTPTLNSTLYTGPINLSGPITLSAIAISVDHTVSGVATAKYTISGPGFTSMSPAFTTAGGAAFTLTVTGAGFASNSTIYWGSTALTTTYVSSTQLTAQVPAADIASAGVTSITVQTPAPNGGTSNALQFEVDSAASGTTSAPTFTSIAATVTAGTTANYPVTLPSTASTVSVTCLNLPTGATCSYSSTTKTVSIATSPTTPKGTYQITVVFTETMASSTGFILLPILLLPLMFIRKKLAAKGFWVTASLGLLLLTGTAFVIGCGGGSSSTSTTPTSPSNPSQVTSSGKVTLTIQ